MKRPLAKPQFTSWNYPDYWHANATQQGGFYLAYDRISWAGVKGAGHMVPQFAPAPARVHASGAASSCLSRSLPFDPPKYTNHIFVGTRSETH